jgi:hypothetical protein
MVDTFGGGEVTATVTTRVDGGYDPATSRNTGTDQVYSIAVAPPFDQDIAADGGGSMSVTTIVIAKTLLDAVTVTAGASPAAAPVKGSSITVTGPDSPQVYTVHRVETLQADADAAAWLVHCTRRDA